MIGDADDDGGGDGDGNGDCDGGGDCDGDDYCLLKTLPCIVQHPILLSSTPYRQNCLDDQQLFPSSSSIITE
ncbi:unnamed protein product [Cercopithifilaria johnstoni]|uniref:Uncharacterized protein n=1 Tax=Cercopithifilaria johnstoni TaxID=2874296 RepID=A0A8J2Q0H6_9BILA|nr:unnamed protein product [Cercopithifilaria johnstoni]